MRVVFKIKSRLYFNILKVANADEITSKMLYTVDNKPNDDGVKWYMQLKRLQ